MKNKKKQSKAEFNRLFEQWTRVADVCPDYEGFKVLVLAILNTQVRDGHLAATTAAEVVTEIKRIEDEVAAMT